MFVTWLTALSLKQSTLDMLPSYSRASSARLSRSAGLWAGLHASRHTAGQAKFHLTFTAPAAALPVPLPDLTPRTVFRESVHDLEST